MERSKKISWQALEHAHDPKSDDWFWIIGVVAVSIMFLAVYFGNFLFALIIILSSVILMLQANHHPRVLSFEVNRVGVKAGDIVFPYSELTSFWVIDEEGTGNDRLLLKSKKLFMPILVLPLAPEVNPDKLREYLLEYLNEEHLEEPVLQKLLESFGL